MNLKDLHRKRARKSLAVHALKQHDAHYIISKPISSEKAYSLSTDGKYVFKVHQKANKNDIKKAFQELYSKVPTAVNVVSMPTKYRQNRKVKHAFKKAIVTLAK